MFKLEFGPKAFIVISDPVVVRHLLKASLRGMEGLCQLQGSCRERPMGLASPPTPLSRFQNDRRPALHYDKGVLAETLEPVMGKGERKATVFFQRSLPLHSPPTHPLFLRRRRTT